MEIDRTKSESDLSQILALQQKNLSRNITELEAAEQGFTFVEHDFALLKQITDAEPAVVARENEKIIGYSLIMTKEFGNQVKVLAPMFRLFDSLQYEGKQISDWRYVLMGQVCIEKEFRGMGIFDLMYHELTKILSPRFDLMITEVAVRNTRSMRAHERFGYKILHTYEDVGEIWNILTLKLNPHL